MRRMMSLLMVLISLAVAAGCSSSETTVDDSVVGVISEVSGDITSVTGFVVLSDDATSHQFTPTPGLVFMGGPLTHLRDHIISGERVVVSFERGDDGALIAVAIDHE